MTTTERPSHTPLACRPCVKPGQPLSGRERQILELLSHGHANRDIGRQLHIAEDTVKTLLRSAFVRLDVRCRAHAVRRGFELGILTTDQQETP